MENNFDKNIKKMLENFEADYHPSDWDRMEQKIEEQSELSPEMEDVLLDGVAYDSLFNYSVDYDPEHWKLMNEKLDDPYALRRRLMKYKVAEVALVLLFIITLIQFLPIKNITKPVANQAITKDPVALIAPALKTEIIEFENSGSTLTENTTDQVSELNTISSNQTKTKNLFNNKVSSNTLTSTQNNLSEPTQLSQDAPKALALNRQASFQAAKPAVTSIENENNANSIAEAESSESIADVSIADLSINDANYNNFGLMQSIQLKGTDKINIPGVDQFRSSKLFDDLKKPIRVRIGMAIGPDANYVMTPTDRRARLEKFNQLALGYSGGFTLGFQYDKWEIETGALYSAVSYDSRNVFQIKGSFAQGGYVEQGLIGAELDIVRLPLNLRYNFFQKKKWNFYAYSGASLNFAVETFYHFTTRDIGRSDASRNFVAPSTNPRAPEESSKPYSHAAYEGIFEGGTLSNNTFLTANLGFGIERFFTPRMSIFFQPGYQHQFTNGLGPQSDQVNSISILTGAKVTLKKRKKK